MKMKNLFLFTCLIAALFSSCKKEAGPTGPAGANGTNGTNGTNGNANVKAFIFNNPITNSFYFSDTLQGLTYKSIDSSLVLCYLQDENCQNFWYPVPGIGCNSLYQSRFYTSATAFDTTLVVVNLELRQPDGSYGGALTQTITKLKVIVAPASSVVVGKKEIDYSNYQEVCRYFRIAE